MLGLGIMGVLVFAIALSGVVLPIVALVRLVRFARMPGQRLSLPPIVWVLLIVAFPWIGSVAFLVAGTRPAVQPSA